MYQVDKFPEIEDDLDALSDVVYDEVVDYFEKYKTDPYLHSMPLYKQGSFDLRGYRKTYIANATYRIIIKVIDGTVKIVSVITVGLREDKKVYQEAFARITK